MILKIYDPEEEIARLKTAVAICPPALQERIVQDCLWGAEFSFLFARDFATQNDVPHVVASLTRVFHYLVQTLFALNGRYFISDKAALATIAGFTIKPANFHEVTAQILARAGATAGPLGTSIARFEALFQEIVALTEGLAAGRYRPKFILPGH